MGTLGGIRRRLLVRVGGSALMTVAVVAAAGCVATVESRAVRATDVAASTSAGAAPVTTTASGPSAAPDPAVSSTTDTTTPTSITTGSAGAGSGSMPAGTLTVQPAPDLPVPGDAETFEGESGWLMEISPTWEEFDLPVVDEEAAWWLKGKQNPSGTSVNVLVEKPMMMLELPAYVELSAANLERIYDADVQEIGVFDAGDHQYGRITYVGNFSGEQIAGIAYLVRLPDGWVVATLASTPDLIEQYAIVTEPLMATLRAG